MALSPSPSTEISFRDPFELDRLADDLANRELYSPNTKGLTRDSIDPLVPDLPEFKPLSHNDAHLTAETFDVEDFLLARKQIPLPDLRTELRQYLAQLKEELVKLINDDYEAFISLSTDLKDEGETMERLKLPMASLKLNALESKTELHVIQQNIHEKLSSRQKLRQEQALLHLLLKISDSVIRLEALLLIASPDKDVEAPSDISGPAFLKYSSHSEEGLEDKSRGNKAKHLGRVASEYTQLLYYARKARTEQCAFVDEVQWRIDRIHSTLSSDLDQLFTQTVVALTDSKGESRGTELEKSKLATDLTECLRTYDALGLWRDAEDVLRQEVVRVFLKKTVFHGALAAPLSPIVPNTPFRLTPPEPMSSINTAQPIPYTPFTAFIPKQNSYRSTISASDIPRAHLLDEVDDPLARLYNQLLRFVERDLCRIMDAAEKITVKPTKTMDLLQSITQNGSEEARGFQIMSKVVWDELGRSIMDEIGGTVFAAGRPKEFRKHYETTQSFLRSLELLAPSRQAVEDMRQHPIYVAFEKRWQLPVYFQLRWKEVIGALEDTLSLTKLEPIISKDGAFATPQAAAVWIAISACWSSEIYIPELGHRFWKLTLQIINRYRIWLDDNISDKMAASQAVSSPSTRAGTPVPDAPVAESHATDDVLLRQFAAIMVDIKAMEANTATLWRQIISMMIPEMPEDDTTPEDALREAVQGLTTLTSSLSSKIIFILTKRCYENLLQVRSIPTQLRMSNKRAPTEASAFIPSILRPVKQFFGVGTTEGPGVRLKSTYLKPFSSEIFDNVTQRYISYLTAMKKTEESLKRLKKNTRPTFSLFGASNQNDEAKDEERIRSQMILDAEAFGNDARTIEVNVDANPHFAALKEIVYVSDAD